MYIVVVGATLLQSQCGSMASAVVALSYVQVLVQCGGHLASNSARVSPPDHGASCLLSISAFNLNLWRSYIGPFQRLAYE